MVGESLAILNYVMRRTWEGFSNDMGVDGERADKDGSQDTQVPCSDNGYALDWSRVSMKLSAKGDQNKSKEQVWCN